MSLITVIAKNAFNKIFKNVAKEFEEDINNVQLGIYYDGGCKYEAYKNFEKVKDIDLDAYTGSGIDFTGGTAAIDVTISQAGPNFARELSEKLGREVAVGEINIIMKYNQGELPSAVLLCSGEKQRMIDIKKEFLNK